MEKNGLYLTTLHLGAYLNNANWILLQTKIGRSLNLQLFAMLIDLKQRSEFENFILVISELKEV